MKKMKCVHPRKAHKLMEDFLNLASDLYYTYDDCDEQDKTEITLVKSDCFSAESVSCVADCDTLEVYYNLDGLFDDGMKMFRSYWTNKVPMLKGFADITLTLLHELGHLETNDEIRKTFSSELRQLAWFAIDNKFNNVVDKNFQYFGMPDEATATKWGIAWLSDFEHRKLAKAFEQKFFACFVEI